MKIIYTSIALANSLVAFGQVPGERVGTRGLIETVRREPSNFAAIGILAKRTDDPQVIPTLKDAFEQARINRAKVDPDVTGLQLSQFLAVYLMERGVRDDIYFNELAKFARETIAADPPAHVFGADPNGKDDPKRGVDPEFEFWCANRHMAFAECFKLVGQLGVNLSLAGAGQDQRGAGIFRDALKMSSASFVSLAVTGLAKIQDAASLPLIAQACSRFEASGAELCAIAATQYNDPRVESLLDRFVRDPETRERAKKDRRERMARESAPPGVGDLQHNEK